MAEFIGIKSYKARGKRLSNYEVKIVEELEPLEGAATQQEVAPPQAESGKDESGNPDLKPAEKPSAKPAEKPAEKPAQKPAQKPAEKTFRKTFRKTSNKAWKKGRQKGRQKGLRRGTKQRQVK